ncbi:MAG: trigger factor [Lachnospiraceae bacterium]|nr:trigger factor [Lachnospiraceae bacterium]
MSMQVEKLEKNMAKLTIEVAFEEFEKNVTTAYNNQKGKISIPGFRKGKVPRQMIEKMYGKEVFYDEAAEITVNATYGQELEANKEIEVVSRPQIEVTQCEAGKPFIYTATVALKPEVELGKYKGVKIDKVETEVTDEDVNNEIEKERERNARTIPVEDRPVKDGDITSIDFEGFVDGVAFEGGKGENYPLTIGSGAFIPGFEEQLVGAKIGEDVEVNVTFPEDYQAENLAGKAAVFKCKVNEIKEKELPELDDEFASEVSEFDTLDEYKADVKKNLAEKKEADAKNEKEDKVIEAIIADAKMEIPDAMVDYETENMVNDYGMRLRQQGLSLEQYFMFTGMDMDSFKAQMKPGALKRIQSTLCLEAVVKAEDIKPTEEDYEKELQKMAENYKMELDKVKATFGDYEKEQIMKDIAMQQAIEFVVSNAKEK